VSASVRLVGSLFGMSLPQLVGLVNAI